jgi:rhodanese-related sulfurtransferase
MSLVGKQLTQKKLIRNKTKKHACHLLDHFQTYLKQTKSDWNYITPHDFYHTYYKPDKLDEIFLIDLRKHTEYKKMHIKGAHNIFWLDLLKPENLKKLPRNKTIFLICYVGHTSSQAMVLLKLLGYKVVSIKFGYGISPAFEVPVAGWTAMRYPTTSC